MGQSVHLLDFKDLLDFPSIETITEVNEIKLEV